jgi:transcriptional regulator with PAS, ATPase and Fis domain
LKTSKRSLDVVIEPVLASPAMRELDKIVRTIADKDVVVTFVGESGTGKEVFARRLHELSSRRTGPFMPINCAAIPEAIFESELFGHEKGAFTGAGERTRGKIEAADGGTLFLDEIGEMPLGVQAKLLRFLETRRFLRVGGTTKISVDVRIVTATLRSIEDEVRAGRFRADLYYRIQGITLGVPPLRERIADVPSLVHQFVAHSSAKHGTSPPRITRGVMSAFSAYEWPGNVRELRNAIELLCLLREGKDARVADLPLGIQRAVAVGQKRAGEEEHIEARLDRPLDETIDRIVQATLALENGNRSRAARRLGLSVRTMQRYVARLGGARGARSSRAR